MILRTNDYLDPIVDRVVEQTLKRGPAVLAGESKKVEKAFIQLLWLGPASAAFKNRICRAIREVTTDCRPMCFYHTKDA